MFLSAVASSLLRALGSVRISAQSSGAPKVPGREVRALSSQAGATVSDPNVVGNPSRTTRAAGVGWKPEMSSNLSLQK